MPERIARKLATKSGISRLIWRANIDNEIAFRDSFLATGGLEWKEDFPLLFDAARPIDAALVELLPEGSCKILDVGAGVLSVVGKTAPNRQIQLTAIDPLAREYDKLLVKYAMTPPVRTKPGKAEELTSIFEKDSFDLVHARNCIDHSFNPLLAFRQMLAVVKPDGYVVAKHLINEGIHEKYVGLHQWNFFSENGKFIIGDRNGRTTDISAELKNLAQIECAESDNWLTVKFKKF